MKPTYDIEYKLRNEGYVNIVGVDEVGRGSLAASVVASAVYIPDGLDTSEINDSKKLSSVKREKIASFVKENCEYGIGEIDNNTIDEINIREATKLAMKMALADLSNKIDISYAIIDGNFVPDNLPWPSKCVINGDRLSVSIAAASIVAKVYRDNTMLILDKKHPIYMWNKNKGYGTKKHREAIIIYGPSKYHRITFKGVKEYL